VTPFEKKNGAGGTIEVESYGILAPPAGAVLSPPAKPTLPADVAPEAH